MGRRRDGLSPVRAIGFGALSPGPHTICVRATDTIGNTSDGTTCATLTVTAATLQSIAVTPANPSIAPGANQQFVATGTYSDATTAVITGSVTWGSATTSVATISAGGLAHAVAAGTSSISATLGGVSGSTR